MVDDEVQYQTMTVQAVRGTEKRTVAKWQEQGWELVGQSQGTLRTTLEFRRPKPKVPWKLIGIAAGLVTIGMCVFGIVAAVQAMSGGDEDPKPAAASSSAAPEPSETPSDEPSEDPSESLSEEPSESPAEDAVLTAKNSPDFAAALKADYCDAGVLKPFAQEHAGETIAFDASIADMANHGSYDTRYDILIAPGDKGPNSGTGPLFKYSDVGMAELNLTGKVPDTIGTGELLRVTATVGKYQADPCLFFLEPVETAVR